MCDRYEQCKLELGEDPKSLYRFPLHNKLESLCIRCGNYDGEDKPELRTEIVDISKDEVNKIRAWVNHIQGQVDELRKSKLEQF